MNSEDVRKGVAEAMDFWLSQHPVSMGEILQSAAEAAFERAANEWLEANREELIKRIAEFS